MAYVVKNVHGQKCWSGIFHYFEGRPNNLFLPCRPKRMPLQWVSKRSDPQQKSGLRQIRSQNPSPEPPKNQRDLPWALHEILRQTLKTLPHFVGISVNFCVTAMDDWPKWFLFVKSSIVAIMGMNDYFVLFPLSLQAVQISPFGLGPVSISQS